ncbi:MAG: SGNH/GDSL hydrolase family protein [Clostridiales bacterium]|nr:SGNH/GDSL hydrolase family protein [Clostridiales bacterium]
MSERIEAPAYKREYYEWVNFWWENSFDFDSPRILFVGDSITNQYRSPVQQKIKNKGFTFLIDCTVGSRSSADPAWICELDYILNPIFGYKYQLIHVNNGLHTGGLNVGDYIDGIKRYTERLRQYQPQAKIALVTSTPVKDRDSNRVVTERNEALKAFAIKAGFEVNDLYAAVDLNSEPWSDGVHFKSESVELLAEATANFIISHLT